MANERSEFNFKRTECACDECVRNCEFISGYLVPSDLQRIADHLGESDLVSFALEHLFASPGATICLSGEIHQIPTIVPARNRDGVCHFLKNGRCTIHAVSPFACRYFDHSQSKEEADAISLRGLMEIAKAWQRGDIYARLWMLLRETGRNAPSPLEARARMKAASNAD